MAEKQSIKRFIVRDPHGHIEQEDSFSVVGEVHVDIVPGYGEPYAESEYVNGILTITIHNIEGNGITDITTNSKEGDEAVNTVTIKTNANPEGVTLDVRNGSRGNGIASSSEVLSPEDGGTNTHTIIDTDGNEHMFHTKNGHTGGKGDQGDSAVYDPSSPDAPDFVMANTTGQSTTKAMTQKAVTDAVNSLAFDVTRENDGATFYSLEAILYDASLSTLIPVSARFGGMTIRFVRSSDNNSTRYVQYRYMSDDAATVATFTNVDNWQGVDAEPVKNSKNMIESGAIIKHVGLLPRAVYLCNCNNIKIELNSTSQKYEIIIPANSVIIYYNGVKQLAPSERVVIELSYEYNCICYDSINNTFVVLNYNYVASLPDGMYFAAITSYNLLYSDLPLTFRGCAYNIPLATSSINGLLPLEDKIKLNNLYNTIPVVATPYSFSFVKIDNVWYFKSPAQSAYYPTLNKNNLAADINLSNLSGYIKILVDDDGVITAVSQNTPTGNKHELFIWYKELDIIANAAPYNINGRAYSIRLATYEKDGLMSKEQALKLDSIIKDPYNTIPVYAPASAFNFEKEDNKWYFRAKPGYANFPTLGNNVNNKAADIDLSDLSGWIKILVDNSGNISAVSKNSDHGNNHVLFVWYIGNEYDMYYTAPFRINGRHYGLPIANSTTNGLMSKEDKSKLDNIDSVVYYDYTNNYPIIPGDLFVTDDTPTLLYKKSMILNPFRGDIGCDMILTSMVNNRHRSLSIQEPINIGSGDIGDTARITVAKNTDITKNVFKDIAVHKATVQSKSGNTPKILMIGDSITHGDHGADSSPIVKVNTLLPSRYNITPIMIGTFAPYGVTGEGRGCFNFEAMAGVENSPYNGTYHFPSVGGTLETSTSKTTTQFQNPFTFPATAEDLVNHPEWCFTNSNNYSDEDDGVSYSDATTEQKANWHFFTFDFDRYIHIWGDENHKPDIITIALGTNDWWPSYQIRMEKTLLAIDIIYAKIREAMSNVKIAFISAQNIATTFQSDSRGNWETEIAPLILNIQKKIATWKAGGDTNVFELPIYACGSRWLAFDGHTAGTSSDLSETNTVQKQTIDANVHLLDGIGSDGYWEYMDCLMTALVCLS